MSHRRIDGRALSYLYAHKDIAVCEACLNSLSGGCPQIPEERAPISEGNGICSDCGKEGTILIVWQRVAIER
jgi:hypothetical protein